MAIAIALVDFNDLGRSVTLTFFFSQTDFIYNYLHIVQIKMNKKSMWEVKKNSKISLPGTWNSAIFQLPGVFMRNLTSWLNSLSRSI